MEKIGIEHIKEVQALHKQAGVQAARALLEQYLQEIETVQLSRYKTTDQDQYFCFSSPLDSLVYKASEQDPRTIHVLDECFDKIYAYLAFCYREEGELELAAQALAQAVRWNPARCEYRLQLADINREKGDMPAALSLAHSVLFRSVYPEEHVEAYLLFTHFFLQQQQLSTAAACLRSARAYACSHAVLDEYTQILVQAGSDPDTLDDELAEQLLDAQGIPDGPHIALMISLLIYADECKNAGEFEQAARYTALVERFLGKKKTCDLATIIREEA